jgi:hypothetical protein
LKLLAFIVVVGIQAAGQNIKNLRREKEGSREKHLMHSFA